MSFTPRPNPVPIPPSPQDLLSKSMEENDRTLTSKCKRCDQSDTNKPTQGIEEAIRGARFWLFQHKCQPQNREDT